MGFDPVGARRQAREESAERRRRRDASRRTGKVCAKCGEELRRDHQAFRVSVYGSPFVLMCGKCAPGWLTSGHGKPMRIIPRVDVHVWECAGCGRQVVFGMSNHQYRKRIYCSDECRKIYRRKRERVGSHEKTCEVCGREFTAARSDAKSCSPSCRQKAYRQRQ
jgi:hypothetical protein